MQQLWDPRTLREGLPSAKQPKQSSSSSSATSNATTPCPPPATDSYFFAIQTSPTSQRSESRHLHRQQQRRRQQIINQTFPCNNSSQNASTSQTTAEAPCGCPLRADPPVHPEQIPFPPLPENQEKLENWILS